MNYSIHLHRRSRHWAKDLQFATGIAVAVGGAAVLLGELGRLFA